MILNLYGPFMLFLLSIIFQFLIKKGDESKIDIGFGLGLGISQKVRKTIIKRIILIILSMISLYYYLGMDYIKFFPTHFQMEVFYDKEGLTKYLESIKSDDIKRLKILKSNYDSLRYYYYESLDKTLKEKLKEEVKDDFFLLKDGQVHSHGSTSIIVKKSLGFQNYDVEKSSGNLEHILERPGKEELRFKTFFDLIESPYDKIDLTLKDLITLKEILLITKYKQILADDFKSNGIIYDHHLFGITRISIFPYPSFSNTLYLLELKDIGLIPVAYAIYKK